MVFLPPKPLLSSQASQLLCRKSGFPSGAAGGQSVALSPSFQLSADSATGQGFGDSGLSHSCHPVPRQHPTALPLWRPPAAATSSRALSVTATVSFKLLAQPTLPKYARGDQLREAFHWAWCANPGEPNFLLEPPKEGLGPSSPTSYANEGLCLHQSQYCPLCTSHSRLSIGPVARGQDFSPTWTEIFARSS